MAYLQIIISILSGYLIGCISPSLILSKIKKVNLKENGTGNLGASNTAIMLGMKAGILVGALDIIKGVLAVLLVRLLFHDTLYLTSLAGTFCVIGHIFPFYLKFRGGKGFASYVGVVLGMDWRLFLIIGVAILIMAFLTDYIVAGTFTCILSFPVGILLTTGSIPALLILSCASVVIFIKHIRNIKKIISHEETRIRSLLHKKPKQ